MSRPTATRGRRCRRPLLLSLVVVLCLGCASSGFAAAPPTARLLAEDGARPGGELNVQIEVAWDGRPEAFAPGLPTLELPPGAGLRFGRTGSRFDGARSTWWTNAVVTLPSGAPPYLLGPASIPLMTPAGGTTVSAAARSVGSASQRSTLVGQGIASAAVIALALAWLALLWRSLPVDTAAQERAALVAAVREAQRAQGLSAAMQAALPLLAALGRDPASRDFLPTVAGWSARRDSLQYGGDEGASAEAQADLDRLLAIAAALE